tara:strand:+ start:3901 stop:4158 length:258 start_codon:yes stop_codon:yes gene_type:complete
VYSKTWQPEGIVPATTCTLFNYDTMTTTTESGGRNNRFATEAQAQVIEQDYFENAERVNGQLAMLGFVAALGSYVFTGNIIPGIF